MPSKTITAIIALTIITLTLILTKSDPYFIYSCLSMIGILGGISIWRNSHSKW